MKHKQKRTVKVLPSSYQPTPKELAEDLRIHVATPEGLAKAIMQDVKIVEKPVAKRRRRARGQLSATS